MTSETKNNVKTTPNLNTSILPYNKYVKKKTWGVTLSHRPGCSGAIMAHCSLDLLVSSYSPTQPPKELELQAHTTTPDWVSLCCQDWSPKTWTSQSAGIV
ncbi:hypothetical protein AAY473_036895, partial [Plecturocebus cupreus]